MPSVTSSAVTVTREQFKYLWPLTASSTTVTCRRGREVYLSVPGDNHQYALNGNAREAGGSAADAVLVPGARPGALTSFALKTCAFSKDAG